MILLNLSKIAKTLFSKRVKEFDSNRSQPDYFCIVSNNPKTDQKQITYKKRNKTFILDGNSVVTMNYIFNNRRCVNILEPEDADNIKKAIARHYKDKGEPFPLGFEFLKAYAPEPPKKKPLFR